MVPIIRNGYGRKRREEEPAHTRQWIVWHVMEHEIYHGGELSLALGTYGVDSFYTWCASTIPLLSPLDSGMCPPFGLELTPFTCSEHVPQGPVLRKRPGSAKEKQPGGKGRDLNECWFTPAFPCPSAAERKKSVEAQRRTTSHGRETRGGATSLFRNRLVAPPQASEEEPDHRHLDQCFARLHFSLVIPGSIFYCGKAIHMSAPLPTRRRLNSETACSRSAFHYLQIRAPLGSAPLS